MPVGIDVKVCRETSCEHYGNSSNMGFFLSEGCKMLMEKWSVYLVDEDPIPLICPNRNIMLLASKKEFNNERNKKMLIKQMYGIKRVCQQG